MEPSQNSQPAKALKAYLASKGFDIPHTIALEALARAGGFKNRHEARAAEKTTSAPQVVGKREMKVWVVTIEHRHGQNVTTHESEEKAFAEIVAYARDNWPDEFPGETPPTGDREIVDTYFERLREIGPSRHEFYEIETSVIEVEASIPASRPLPVKRPEFTTVADGEPSLHETLAALAGFADSLPAAHAANAKKIVDSLLKRAGYSTLSLASDLLEEQGAFIAHMETVDDLDEQFENLKDGGDYDSEKPPRWTLLAAVRTCARKHGMSDSAIEAFRDMMERVAIEFDEEDKRNETAMRPG